MADGDEPTITDNEEPDDIPRTDISLAIEKKIESSNFVILQYTLEPPTQRTGQLGENRILHITLLNVDGEERKLNYFVKYFPKFETPAKFAEGIGAFQKEMFVYELFEKFSVSGIDIITSVTPRCYIAQYNKYLILDNLINEGFTTLDKHKTLDYDCVLTVLKSLAKLHASSLIYEEQMSAKLGERYRLLDDYEKDFEESFFNDKEDFINVRGVEASIKCIVKEIDIFDFPDKLKSGKSFSEVAKEICHKIYKLVKPSKKFRNVLNHGDLWATNFLIKHDPRDHSMTGCKFVDFQCGRYVPPAQDVLSLLYLTTSRDFRKKYMYQVIGMYYSYLDKHLKFAGFNINSILPFDEFLDSCEEQKLFAIIQTAIYFPLILINNDLVESYFVNKELNEKILFEDRSYLVLAHMDKDESYTNRLKESLEDLREFCERL